MIGTVETFSLREEKLKKGISIVYNNELFKISNFTDTIVEISNDRGKVLTFNRSQNTTINFFKKLVVKYDTMPKLNEADSDRIEFTQYENTWKICFFKGGHVECVGDYVTETEARQAYAKRFISFNLDNNQWQKALELNLIGKKVKFEVVKLNEPLKRYVGTTYIDIVRSTIEEKEKLGIELKKIAKINFDDTTEPLLGKTSDAEEMVEDPFLNYALQTFCGSMMQQLKEHLKKHGYKIVKDVPNNKKENKKELILN